VLKSAELQQQRVLLIEAWRDFEEEHGDAETQKYVVVSVNRVCFFLLLVLYFCCFIFTSSSFIYFYFFCRQKYVVVSVN
jgi:hypothetical protein